MSSIKPDWLGELLVVLSALSIIAAGLHVVHYALELLEDLQQLRSWKLDVEKQISTRTTVSANMTNGLGTTRKRPNDPEDCYDRKMKRSYAVPRTKLRSNTVMEQ